MLEETFMRIQELMAPVFELFNYQIYSNKSNYLFAYNNQNSESHIDPIMIYLLTVYLN